MERINAYLLISQEKKTTVTSDGLAECCVCDILHNPNLQPWLSGMLRLGESPRCLADQSKSNFKLKKADRSGGGGHLGCSQSYNSSEYQEHLEININTQGRE